MSDLERDILEFGAIGGEGTGVTRYAWSDEVMAAHALLAERGRDLGLAAETDAAGNTVVRWEEGSGPAVLVGSHLDTVPRGGRYDGALGVLSGLEAVRQLRQRGVQPARPVWIVSFTDEEGSRFGTSLLGSRAFVGEDLSDLRDRADADGVTLREAMARQGFHFERLPQARAIDRVGCYLELHIEQGPVLEHAGIDIGVVTAIVGLIGYHVRLEGQANHAGTTPMAMRRDALAGAARVALELRDLARATEGMTANVGVIGVEPGGKNVVPGVCDFTIDVRSATREGFDALHGRVRAILERIAGEEQLGLAVTEIYRLDPLVMDAGIVDAFERAAELEGASHLRLPSGAGHDAMIVGAHVPAGMLFVPSRGGISHNPAELTPPEQCDLGARVLARTVELLATA